MLALAAGVFVWSPWQPNPPSGVRATAPTATSARISWKPSGGVTVSPSGYRVLRDGRQVGAVPANVTSWTDEGLAPATTYQYTVVAAGPEQSHASAAATVTTLAPGPVNLTARATRITVTLTWRQPVREAAPKHYVVSYGSVPIATLPGTATSYTDATQYPGTSFRYTVTAEWGNRRSVPAAVTGTTVAAPLEGALPVLVDTTSSAAGWTNGWSVGDSWHDTWSVTPSCSATACSAMTLMLAVDQSNSDWGGQFPLTVRRSGAGYSGSATTQDTECDPSASDEVDETDTVTLTLTPHKVQNGGWTAWTGVMTLSAPPVYLPGWTCSSGFWSFSVTAGLSRRLGDEEGMTAAGHASRVSRLSD